MLRARFSLVLVLVLLAAPSEARRRAVTGTTLPPVDAIALAALEERVPAISIAVRHRNLIYARAYGLFDVANAVPATEATAFQIASVSKQFTAAAVMRLVEQGRLRLNDRARQYVPSLREDFDAITIEHLLTHTSGLANYNELLVDAYEPMTQEQIIALINSRALAFVPGTRWEYNNSGYYLLGVVIEKLTGQSYAEYLHRELFLPLGLLETSYCGASAPVPAGYLRIAGTQRAVEPADMSLVYAAGALCSTARDLLRWNAALVSGLAVSPESYARMTTPARLNDGTTVPYGFGLTIGGIDGHRRIAHGGAILGFVSHLAWYPDDDLTIAVLINEIDVRRDRAGEIANEVARLFLQR